MKLSLSEDLLQTTEEANGQVRRNRFRRFILLLLLLVAVSSSLIGYLIGRIVYIDYYTGQIVDTITIDFGNPTVPINPTPIYQINIVGIVQYTDGTPYANGTIELRSEPRYTTTNAYGRFEFLDVEEGIHTISVIQNGVVIASTTVNFQIDSFLDVSQVIELDAGGYLIRIPLDVQILNIMLVLNRVADASMPSGYRYEIGVRLATAVEIAGAADPTTPTTPTDPTIPTDPTNPTDPANPPDPTNPTDPTTPVDPENPGGSVDQEEPGGSTDPTDPNPPTPPDPVIPPVPTDPPKVTVTDQIDGYNRNWQKITSIDIFGERAGNSGVQTINNQKVIAPGSKGRFIFKIKNPMDFSVDITVDLKDSDANLPKIPMFYRLIRGVSGQDFVGGTADWRGASAIVELITLNANAEKYYTLEWQWDGSDNVLDTAIGNQTILPAYILDIIITAQ